MGRPPSNNPKSEAIHVRLDKECLDILDTYCEKHNIARTEAIRHGIKKLDEEKNK